MKNYHVTLDKLEQPFQFSKVIVDNILAKEKENNGWVRISNNLSLVRTSIRPEYEHCFKVNLETNAETITLGYLSWGSHNKWLDSIYFKVYNKRLYDNSKVNIDDIRKALGLTVKRLPNVDIAVDFNFDVVNKIRSMYHRTDLEAIVLNKLRVKSNDIAEVKNTSTGSLLNPYKYEGFTIKGKDIHKLELAAYDKCIEIEQQSPHKEYIREIEGFKRIFRLEVRVNGYQLDKTLRALDMSVKYFMENIHDSSLQLKVWEHIFDRILRFRIEGKRQSENIIDLLLYEKSVSQKTKAYSKAVKHPRKRHRKRLTRDRKSTSEI